MRALISLFIAFAAFAVVAQGRYYDDPRLQGKFTKEYQAISVKDLVADLSKQSGVLLRVSNRITNDMIILAVRDRSYAEVLGKIAAHFDWAWESRGQEPNFDYLLTQPTESISRENKLRKEQEIGRMKPIKDAILRDSAVTPEKLAEMKATVLAWLKKEPKINWEETAKKHEQQGDDYEELPEERDYRFWSQSKESRLTMQLSEDRAAVAKFLLSVPDATWQSVFEGESITYCTVPRMYQKPLSSAWVATFNRWTKDQGADPQSSDLDQKLAAWTRPRFNYVDVPHEIEPEAAPMPGSAPPERMQVAIVSIMIQGASQIPFMTRGQGASMTATVIGMDRNRRAVYSVSHTFPTGDGPYTGDIPYLGGGAITADAGSEEQDPSPKPKDYSKDPLLGKSVKLPVPDMKAMTQGEEGSISFFLKLLEDMGTKDPLNWFYAPVRLSVAAATELCLISDAFDSDMDSLGMMMFMGGQDTAPKTVGSILDGLKESAGQDWEVKSGWITLRTKQWAYLRPRVMPRDVLRSISRVTSGKIDISLEELATLANSASELQYRNLPAGIAFMSLGGSGAQALFSPQGRAVLRFWGTLNPLQRNQFAQGNVIPFRFLTPVQRENLIAALRSPSSPGGRYQSMMDEDFMSGSNAAKPKEEYAEPPQPFDWTEYIPDSTPMPLSVAAKVKAERGFFMEVTKKGGDASVFHQSIRPFMLESMTKMDEKDKEMTERMGLTPRMGREDQENFTFRIILTDKYAVRVGFKLSHRIPGSEFDPFHPPDDVLKTIKDESEKRKKLQDEVPPPDDDGGR